MFPAKGIACAKREETQLAQGVCSINFEVGQRRCVDLERVSSRVVTIVGGGGGMSGAGRLGVQRKKETGLRWQGWDSETEGMWRRPGK